MKIELSVNGEIRSADVEPRKTLLDCLRDDFNLTGSHTGCEHGVAAPARFCLTASRRGPA
jgi:aerobic carbon-monoxide dehydrogenase small subunit